MCCLKQQKQGSDRKNEEFHQDWWGVWSATKIWTLTEKKGRYWSQKTSINRKKWEFTHEKHDRKNAKGAPAAWERTVLTCSEQDCPGAGGPFGIPSIIIDRVLFWRFNWCEGVTPLLIHWLCWDFGTSMGSPNLLPPRRGCHFHGESMSIQLSRAQNPLSFSYYADWLSMGWWFHLVFV